MVRVIELPVYDEGRRCEDEGNLAGVCFPKCQIDIDFLPGSVIVSREKRIAEIEPSFNRMFLYSKNYLDHARDFGERYEKEFGGGEFLICTSFREDDS